MLISDRLYGSFNIDEPVLVELINSRAVQRLKGIAQLGIPDEFYSVKSFSRYEHSVGVMLLLRRLGANEEEQIAGLLHDASHTAFSHVIDWVVKENGSEDNYQDNHHLEYLLKTELPSILERYGYDINNIADYDRFGLLERDMPDLCADRVDYGLREFDETSAAICLKSLKTQKRRIVFSDIKAAKLFAVNFLDRTENNWASMEAVNRYRYFSEALRIAVKLDQISMEDFWQDDTFVFEKLKRCNDARIVKILNQLQILSWDNLPKDGLIHVLKFRHVDPLIIIEGDLHRLSEVDIEFKRDLEEARVRCSSGVPKITI
ncbi:MAG: HD domain-containing protein [Patescibacteria group bacterium]|nr:HD domain-containing protein [Patescibacteria group bacterium]